MERRLFIHVASYIININIVAKDTLQPEKRGWRNSSPHCFVEEAAARTTITIVGFHPFPREMQATRVREARSRYIYRYRSLDSVAAVQLRCHDRESKVILRAHRISHDG